MPYQFGKKPTVARVFVRVQEIDDLGKTIQTRSMNVWQVPFSDVVHAVVGTLSTQWGEDPVDNGVEEAPIPIKGRLRRGRKA